VLAPLSWLRDFAPFDQPVEVLADMLSNLGLVVDGITHVGGGLDGVEVVEILDIRPHPNADKIRLVDVDRGDGEKLQIACGAWNMAVGDLVPLATIGTVLPGGMEIARRKMRGEWSNGMLCAAEEVGLPNASGEDGLLILPPGLAPPGTPLTDALGIVPDVVFDLDISPNRPDCLSIAGIARDLAAALELPWSLPAGPPAPPVDAAVPAARVDVDSPDLCPRFTGTVIEGVAVGPSPAWMAQRLTLAGMRPISNVVDVSNYVMLELGQPNHAYDLDRLGGGGLVARRARPAERLTTLDGVERVLEGDDCVIGDATGNPVGVGGIMGGASAEIGPATTTVLLEAATFTAMAIARTGKRLNLHSEARARFERGVDPHLPAVAVDRFTALLAATQDTAPRPGPTTDIVSENDLPASPTILCRTAKVNALLGTDLPDAEVASLLGRLGFDVSAVGEGVASVRVPSWRPDIDREVDLVEEVARLHGYERIARTVPEGHRPASGLTTYQRFRRRVREALAGAGLLEAWTTTFLDPADLGRAGLPAVAVEVANPLDRRESILRTSLLPGLLGALRFNADRQAADVELFEVGRTFARPSGDRMLPDEREELAAVLSGEGRDATTAAWLWALLVDALRLEGLTVHADEVVGLHPTRAARILGADGEVLGALGEVAPEVAAAFGLRGRVAVLHLDLERLAAQPTRSELAAPISRFPASDIDLAFVVADGVPAASVEATVREAAGDLLESVALFDVYRGERLGAGRRSLAYRLRFRAPDRTLTDGEVGDRRAAVINAVELAHGGELRG
jgi:phenylalanyl-tRNA synthetase beta chain